jgi:hypothetical protein
MGVVMVAFVTGAGAVFGMGASSTFASTTTTATATCWFAMDSDVVVVLVVAATLVVLAFATTLEARPQVGELSADLETAPEGLAGLSGSDKSTDGGYCHCSEEVARAFSQDKGI